MKFISEAGLQELDHYKYVSGNYSWLDNKMKPFWLKVAYKFPEVLYFLKNKLKHTLLPKY